MHWILWFFGVVSANWLITLSILFCGSYLVVGALAARREWQQVKRDEAERGRQFSKKFRCALITVAFLLSPLPSAYLAISEWAFPRRSVATLAACVAFLTVCVFLVTHAVTTAFFSFLGATLREEINLFSGIIAGAALLCFAIKAIDVHAKPREPYTL